MVIENQYQYITIYNLYSNMSSESKRENYHIISLIGKGAYGEVYKARKKLTGQFVAIKTIKKKGKQQKDIKAMRQQIAILKKLKHPNIVVLLDSFETNSQFIIVTELGQGQLFNIIQDDQYLQEPEIRKVAQQLVRALHYIHSNRITHRDLKPQNILMTSEGNIKLCDFGFARYMSYKTEVLTSLKGTPLYMAPEVVQEQPYTHTADLWSLGVILYQLATGSPPFSAANLLTLVEHISKDPVRYPDSIQGDFKNLLKGLLNKDPNARLGWPDLLNHPFIRQTEQQKIERKQKVDKFSNWIEQNHYMQQDENSINMTNTKSLSNNNFEDKDKSREISPHKTNSITIPKTPPISDSSWNNYIKMANDEKGANQLRVDAQFLDKLLNILSGNPGQVMRNKQQKNLLQCSLKVLTQVLMKSKTPENKQADISKKLNIPNHLLGLMKSMLKMENGKNYIQIISDIIKLIGLLAKTTFNKNIGIQMVYVRSFLPLLPSLLACATSSSQLSYQGLTMNLLRTIGIFANNASVHYLRSFSFYKDIVQIKFIPEFLSLFKCYSQCINVGKLLVQVISAFMHPVYGDIQCFPWKRANCNGIMQYKEFSTMLECVRQSLINGLLELDWMSYFEPILQLQDQSSILPKISIYRIILQSLRQSKQFAENLVSKPNQILKHTFSTLTHSNPIMFSTTCIIVSHLLKYNRERKKEQEFIQKEYLTQHIINTLLNKIEVQSSKGVSLAVFGVFLVSQEIVGKGGIGVMGRLGDGLVGERMGKIVVGYLGGSDKSKIQEMRNLEGSNYGIHSVGYYDPIFLCYHRLITKYQKQNKENNELSKMLGNSQIHSRMSQILNKLSSKTDLSPRGLIAYLMFLYDLISIKMPNQFMQGSFLRNLINLLSQNQVDSLAQWPANFGGGDACLQILLGTIMNIFLIYLQNAEKQPEILKVIYQSQLIRLVIEFAKHLSAETITTVVTFMGHLLSFNSDKIGFVRQFIEFSGMALFVRFNLLKIQQYESASIIEACNLLSQIARSSKQTYQHIDSIDPYLDIKSCLKSNDLQVRSRALYLVGNMCRHSSYFYEKLQQYDLLKDVILLCNSQDKETRKYGCIALGNAGFHDSKLYPNLRMAIPVLVTLLKDNDEKTRSNAAAALGNLARNSDQLDQDFVSTGANYQLVNMIINDKSLSAKRVSIMAIINLLGLKESSKLLKSLNIYSILGKWVPPNFTSDPNLIKTAQKALDKLSN